MLWYFYKTESTQITIVHFLAITLKALTLKQMKFVMMNTMTSEMKMHQMQNL